MMKKLVIGKMKDETIASCPLHSNQNNDKKMTNFLVKNEKKMKKTSQKMPTKTL